MTDGVDAARQDLAYLRSLVEDTSALLGPLGWALVIAGVVQALSALRFWAVGQGLIAWPHALRPLMGVDGVIVQVAAMIVLSRGKGQDERWRASGGPAARVIRGALTALAWAMGAAFLGLLVASRRTGGAEPLATGFPIVIFALTSATWQVVFAVYRRPWALWAAIAAAIFALGMGLTTGMSAGALVVAAGLLVCLAAPGWAMIRQSREN